MTTIIIATDPATPEKVAYLKIGPYNGGVCTTIYPVTETGVIINSVDSMLLQSSNDCIGFAESLGGELKPLDCSLCRDRNDTEADVTTNDDDSAPLPCYSCGRGVNGNEDMLAHNWLASSQGKVYGDPGYFIEATYTPPLVSKNEGNSGDDQCR